MRLKFLVLLLVLGGVSSEVFAAVSERYASIVDRNAFGLGQVVVEKTPEPTPVLLNVSLTGISEFKGDTVAYFMIPGKSPNEPSRYVTLKEGESDGVLELAKIFKEEGEVQIRNTGVEAKLKLGMKPQTKEVQVKSLRSISLP